MMRRSMIILFEMIRCRMIIHFDGEKEEEEDPLCDDQKEEDDLL